MTDLQKALAFWGKNASAREQFIELLKSLEQSVDYEGSIRDEITGPIVDALCADVDVLRKELQNGVKFDFLYRSKIARDFLLCEPAVPEFAWEPQTSKLLLHLAKDIDCAIVGGAYFGDQAILLADAMRSTGGQIHAFEPNNDQRAMLIHNAELNELNNVTANGLGLWSASDERLKLVGFDSFAHPEVADQDEDSFPTICLNDYVKQKGISSVGLIALDMEGAEYPTLQGATDLFAKADKPNIVFEVHRHYVDWSNGLENTDIIRLLTEHGYHVYAVRDYNSNVDMPNQPVELIPADSVYLEGPPHGFNMLAINDHGLIDNDDFRLCHNVSPKLLAHKDPALHHPLA